jgi:hypothetical protein
VSFGLVLNPESSCLSLLSVEITDVYHHTWLYSNLSY